ncbi:MAG: bifunctional adenosylcobinamide kinase/adenosylcobinamide-phosphate guanylyltransferase [Candidatus Polarisedimenticolaceae bacterium]|nr:bifunctional adenosylcobinamide kinase/adenosylcobinamide-phosphate guanylyltransferase [Candidatus Polarisedimenticolaceae bacterium]
MKRLILGGIRSGKSRLAERFARESGLSVTYIATATVQDDAMQQRIGHHQRRRPKEWPLIEEPYRLAKQLQKEAREDRFLLVDCLTLWLTNLLLLNDETRLKQELTALQQSLPKLPGEIVLVSNETGLGVVPMGELSRRFCDEAGFLHQDLAQICDQVILTVAGLPHFLKGKPNAI